MEKVITVHVSGPKLLAVSLCSVLNTFPDIAAFEAVPRISVKGPSTLGERPVLLALMPSLSDVRSHSHIGSHRDHATTTLTWWASASGESRPSRAVLILRGTTEELAAASALGFRSCVGIEDEPHTVRQAILAAARSGAYSSASLTGKLAVPLERRTRREDGASQGIPRETLTKRERIAATLAAAGFSNAEIATQLSISVDTVKTHLREAYKKLGIQRRGQIPL